MDDPLSAVDQNVGKHIFDQCIRGYLSDRTVIFVTHQLQYLHRCDRVVMLQNGKIAYQGSYNELMANEPSFATLINTHVSNEDEDGVLGSDNNKDDTLDNEDYAGREITLEEHLESNEARNQVTATGPEALERLMRQRLGAGPRRHTLPPGTRVGDAPGTATIINQNYATITPKERLRLLQRQLPFIDQSSILADTLQQHTNLDFISRVGPHDGYSSPVNDSFNRAILRNELTIHSIPEGGIYGSRMSHKKRARSTKQRHSVAGLSMRKASVGGDDVSFDYTDHEGHAQHHHHGEPIVVEDSDVDSDDEEGEREGVLIGEDKSMDELGFADYVKYFKAGSGVIITILIIILFFFAHGIRIGSDYWLRLWVPNTLHTSDSVYLGVYGLFIAAFTTAVLARGLFFALEAIRKSRELHDRAFAVSYFCEYGLQ